MLVMVVDDSITVRKVTTRLLERQGFEVLTAKDGIDAMGVMHSNVHITQQSLRALRASWDGAISVYPDSGYFKMPHWQFEEIIPPAEFSRQMQAWVDAERVQVVGGCCGLGVEHIAALRKQFAAALA